MAAFLINTPEPMMKVRVISIKDHSQKTLEMLQELGVLHIEEASDLSPLDRDRIEGERRRIRESINLLDDIITHLPAPQTVFVGDASEADTLSHVIAEVGKLHRSLSQTIEKYSSTREELLQAERLDRFLGRLGASTNPLMKDLQYSGNYLYSTVIVVSEETFRIFDDKTKGILLRNLSLPLEDGMVISYLIASSDSRKLFKAS